MPICFNDILNALDAWPDIFVTNLLRYLIPAGAAFLLLWVLFRRRLEMRKIQSDYPAFRHLRHKFLYSMLTVLIFSANGVLVVASIESGHRRDRRLWLALLGLKPDCHYRSVRRLFLLDPPPDASPAALSLLPPPASPLA